MKSGRVSLLALVTAEAVSNVGSRMTLFAIPWLVLVTTGSPVKVGIVTGAETLTYVVSGVLAAPLQDRLGDRRTSILSDVASAAALGAIALLGEMDFAVLVALAGLAGLLRAQADRAKVTLLAPLMGAGGDYARVAAVREGVLRTSTLAGSSLAGIAIAFAGATGAIWIDAATFLLAAGLVLVVPKPSAAEQKPQEAYFASLRSGFETFRRDRLMRGVTSMLFFTNLFNQAAAAVFVPLWVLTNMDSPAALGAVATAYAMGLIGGSFLVAWLAPLLPRYPLLVAGYFLGGTPRFLVLALSDNLTVIVVVTLLGGVAMSSLNPTVAAMIYQRTPKEMLARMGGIITAVAFGGAPLGGLLAGTLVEVTGLINAILIATAMYFVVTLTPIVGHRLWRELNDTAPPRPKPDGTAKLSHVYSLKGLLGPRITVRYADGRWTVQARHRLRRLAGRRGIPAKQAAHALTHLNVPTMRTALEDAVAHDLSRTRRRAERLRAALSDYDRVDGPHAYPSSSFRSY